MGVRRSTPSSARKRYYQRRLRRTGFYWPVRWFWLLLYAAALHTCFSPEAMLRSVLRLIQISTTIVNTVVEEAPHCGARSERGAAIARTATTDSGADHSAQ